MTCSVGIQLVTALTGLALGLVLADHIARNIVFIGAGLGLGVVAVIILVSLP